MATLVNSQRFEPADYGSIIVSESPVKYWKMGIPVVGSPLLEKDFAGSTDGVWNTTPGTPTNILPNNFGGIITLGKYCIPPVGGWSFNVRSIEAWVKFTSSSDMSIWSHRNGAEHSAVYHDPTNGLRFCLGTGGGAGVSVYNTNTALNNGLLHHIVCEMDTSTNVYRMYVDGVQVKTGSHTYSPSGSAGQPYIASEAGGRYWNGGIGHIAVRQTLMGPTLIAAHNTLGRA